MDSRVANQFIMASIEVFRKVGNVSLKKTGLEYFPAVIKSVPVSQRFSG